MPGSHNNFAKQTHATVQGGEPRRTLPLRIAAFLRGILLPAPVSSGWVALVLLSIVVLETGLEAAYVQLTTTRTVIDASLLLTPSFLFLLSLDLLVPMTAALLSRRLFIAYLALDCMQNIILLHYNIFFYNTLTLATIYHSMQGAASLGADIFGFARWNIIAACLALFACKAVLVRLSLLPHSHMPWLWKLRGITAVCCMTVIWYVSALIYGQTGLSALWIEPRGHRTAAERRLEQGAREAVRNIGYLATWIGELRSGTYKDTALIYAEMRCLDPDTKTAMLCSRPDYSDNAKPLWHGLPVPQPGNTVVLIQVESLDFAALGMRVNGHTVLPFISHLAGTSLTLKAFAPHKVGSSNSDYEILNRRVADQNVMYYSYITEYPDSAIRVLAEKGYNPAVFHGLSGKLFNLRSAYAAQGFERFYFKEELNAAGYASSRYIMEHVMDADLFAEAAEQLRQNSRPNSSQNSSPEGLQGDRQAQFIISMSSHIPFLDPLPEFKSAGGVFARYVSSLHYLDRSLAAYYEQLPDGALLVLWGDHGSDVTYPDGFPKNSRHVPFMVHIKGDGEWMRRAGSAEDGECEKSRYANVLGSDLLAEVPYHESRESPVLASRRIYTLCELGHFLHRIVERTLPGE